MQNRNEENTRLRPGKVSTWYLVRYDVFWSSIRIDKVLIALQNMVSSGFIDGLRKASNVPGHKTVVVVFPHLSGEGC